MTPPDESFRFADAKHDVVHILVRLFPDTRHDGLEYVEHPFFTVAVHAEGHLDASTRRVARELMPLEHVVHGDGRVPDSDGVVLLYGSEPQSLFRRTRPAPHDEGEDGDEDNLSSASHVASFSSVNRCGDSR